MTERRCVKKRGRFAMAAAVGLPCVAVGLALGYAFGMRGERVARAGAAGRDSIDYGGEETGRGEALVLADFEPSVALLLHAGFMMRSHPEVLLAVADALRDELPILGIANQRTDPAAMRQFFSDHGFPHTALRTLRIPGNSMWVRDYGPHFVRLGSVGGGLALLDAFYVVPPASEHRLTDEVFPVRFGNAVRLPVIGFPFALDGGNVLSNGRGLLLSTKAILADNEMLGYNPDEFWERCSVKLDVRQWLFVDALEGEETGHVDMFAAFLDPYTALVAECDPAVEPENAAILDNAAARLREAMVEGQALAVHRIPSPPRVNGRWRTYCNVIFTPRSILVPVYADVEPQLQESALDVYRRLAPRRRIVPIPADTLVPEGGTLRCISKGIPRGVLLGKTPVRRRG